MNEADSVEGELEGELTVLLRAEVPACQTFRWILTLGVLWCLVPNMWPVAGDCRR